MDFKKYSFVLAGELRKRIVSSLEEPKTVTELAKEAKLNLSNISRVLIQFEKQGLAKCLTPDYIIGRVYGLTEKGRMVREEIIKRTDKPN